MSKVTYHLPGKLSVTYESATESRLKVFLTTFWHYPVLLLCVLAGVNLEDVAKDLPSKRAGRDWRVSDAE